MKEWDLDAYIRKFKDTLTVFKEPSGRREAKYVKDITILDNGSVAFKTLNEDWNSKIEPDYFRFEGRLYPSTDGIVAIRRRVKKTWRIGLCPDAFIITHLKGKSNLANIHILEPFEINIETALKKEGAITNKFYLTKNQVLLLDKEVGLRKGSKFLVKESVCQELQDALQGFECSIST